MKKVNAMEMRNIEGGATYTHTVKCNTCGAVFTGKASGTWLLAPIWKYNARNKAYNKYYAHIAESRNRCF